MKRIQLNTPMDEAILNMVEGNVGAVTIVKQIIEKKADWIFELARLDDQEIYGSDIWICYKNICDYDIDKFIAKNKHQELKGMLVKYKEQK